MCIAPKMPKPQKPPPPPNKLDNMSDALRAVQMQRAAGSGTRQSDTNVTGGNAGNAPVYTPAAGNKTILGG